MSQQFWVAYWKAFDRLEKASDSCDNAKSFSDSERRQDNYFTHLWAFYDISDRLINRKGVTK